MNTFRIPNFKFLNLRSYKSYLLINALVQKGNYGSLVGTSRKLV